MNMFGGGGMGHRQNVTVRRGKVLEDAFNQLKNRGSALKNRFYVQFRNDQGLQEAGIDGGGLFKVPILLFFFFFVLFLLLFVRLFSSWYLCFYLKYIRQMKKLFLRSLTCMFFLFFLTFRLDGG